jgi:hypothetical protein
VAWWKGQAWERGREAAVGSIFTTEREAANRFGSTYNTFRDKRQERDHLRCSHSLWQASSITVWWSVCVNTLLELFYLFVLLCLFFFWNWVSLCSWPGTHDIPASASWVLGLQMCTTIQGSMLLRNKFWGILAPNNCIPGNLEGCTFYEEWKLPFNLDFKKTQVVLVLRTSP